MSSDSLKQESAESAQDEAEHPARDTVTWTEAIVPIAGIAFSIYYLATIWDMPFEARMSGMLVSGSIFILTALLAVRWCKDAIQHGVDSGIWVLLGETNTAIARRLSVLALTVAYVILLPPVGFFIACFTYLLASMAVLGVRNLRHLILVPLLATGLAHLLFIIVLGISLPEGIVGGFLNSIFGDVGL
ncbi:MAG: tripartite tricarboxylate transporter TctB family protein [Halofilum sp. (in: g-proteobacteria)]